MYPVDSFTTNMKHEASFPTDRVFELLTPKQYIRRSPSYSEILYAKRNDKKNDELNSTLSKLKPFAVYCYDVITENDVKTANNLGIGIVLVKTMNYTPYISKEQIKMYETLDATPVKATSYQTDIYEAATGYLGRGK